MPGIHAGIMVTDIHAGIMVTDIHAGMVDDCIHVAIVGVWHTHGYGICLGIHMTSGIHVARVSV